MIAQLEGGRFADSDIFHGAQNVFAGGIGSQARFDPGAQARDRKGQHVGAARRLAEPERNIGRLAVGVLDPHRPALDSLDAVGGIAELKHIALHALDRKILIDRADDHIFRLQHHLIIGGVGNSAAGGQGGGARAPSGAQHFMDRIAVNQRAAPAMAGGEALGQHPHNRVEFCARQRPEGPGAQKQCVKCVFRPVLRRNFGDDLLGEHVLRLVRYRQAVEFAPPHAVEQSGAFDEIVARQRKQAPLRRAVDGVAGASDPLQESRDRARRAELADQIHIADIDAELQRGGSDQRPQLAGLEPLLGREAFFLRHAAVMRRDGVFAEPFR